MSQFRRRWLLVAGVAGVLLAAPAPWLVMGLIAPDTTPPPADSRVLDRHGAVLHHLSRSGERQLWLPLEKIPRDLVNAYIAAEDTRFASHRGVDFGSIARALWDNVTHGRVVSGASTITQQVVRLIEPRPRSWSTKLIEALKAFALEQKLDKAGILEQYLNRVPMPGNFRGVEAGARFLFGRGVTELTRGELAILAAFPQAPTRLDPRRGEKSLKRLLRRRAWVLERMFLLGFISADQLRHELENVPEIPIPGPPMLAPHLASELESKHHGEIRTTLDGSMQDGVEQILASHRARLRARACRQAACVVLDNESGEVLAWVGSIEWALEHQGFNDGVLARRSAGSTLKPFAYALALERGFHLSSVITDLVRTYRTPRGDYRPENDNEREHGPVTLRSALACSLNAAAIELLRRTGVGPLSDLLLQLHLVPSLAHARELGLGIIIGNTEVRLIELAAAYRSLARGGMYRPARWLADEPAVDEVRVLEPDVTSLITDVLADPGARIMTFGTVRSMIYPFPVAVKTGTSTGYRDLWAAGYTSRYTVAVWCGNFDGSPTARLSGSSAAAPILKDVLLRLHGGRTPPVFERPSGIEERAVCSDSGMLPGDHCSVRSRELFLSRRPLPGRCTWHSAASDGHVDLGPEFAGWIADRADRGLGGRYRLARPSGASEAAPASGIRIVSPMNGDRFVQKTPTGEVAEIVVEAVPERPVEYLRWFLDREELATTPPPYRWRWKLPRGHHTLVVTDPDLTVAARVTVQVE